MFFSEKNDTFFSSSTWIIPYGQYLFVDLQKKIELPFKCPSSSTMNHILKNNFSFFLVQDMEQTNHSSALLNIGGVMYKY